MTLSVMSHVYDAQSAVLRQIAGLVHQTCRLGWVHETFHPKPVP
jgi:hypothetical protein